MVMSLKVDGRGRKREREEGGGGEVPFDRNGCFNNVAFDAFDEFNIGPPLCNRKTFHDDVDILCDQTSYSTSSFATSLYFVIP
jgi:hypothetical protein